MPTQEPSLRLCYAATHVVMDRAYARLGHSLEQPGDPQAIAEHIDWRQTLRLRQFLAGHGLGIAEAMDTAQRFHLGWPGARRLIAECGALRPAPGFCAGAGTDHLPAIRGRADLIDGVVEQCRYIDSHGGIPVILPMPWLCAQQASPDDYVAVYEAIVAQVRGPVFVHWLGEMFLPALRGYFPGDSFQRVMALDPGKVRGCKLSLLDAAFEVQTRRELLPRGQIVLTGDDFHFGRMILGGDAHVPGAPAVVPPVTGETTIQGQRVALGDFSHALLGILDAIAAPTALALQRLRQGDAQGFLAVMDPCEELGRHVFGAPTRHYKAGLAFLAWLNGLQDDFTLVNHEERARDRAHYLRAAELAGHAGAIADAPTFATRLAAFRRGG